MMDYPEYDLNFYITQFRKMFKRIVILYLLITSCLIFVLMQLSSIREPVFYAASESGSLRKLTAYSKKDIDKFIATNTQNNQ